MALGLIDTPGFEEILMILVVALLVFGGKLPEVARDLGRKLSGLKRNVENVKGEIQRQMDEAERISKEDLKPPSVTNPEKNLPPGPS